MITVAIIQLYFVYCYMITVSDTVTVYFVVETATGSFNYLSRITVIN